MEVIMDRKEMEEKLDNLCDAHKFCGDCPLKEYYCSFDEKTSDDKLLELMKIAGLTE